MIHFEQTWRWFGPNDRILLNEIYQTGATGIVTALHQIPVGDEWGIEAIMERKQFIEKHNLRWSVVESVPVSEDIKRQTGPYLKHIENYKKTLINLAQCGIKTVCYNFMPVLDWTRTDLVFRNQHGSQTLKYEYHKFAAFDLFILKRDGASSDYPAEVVEKANQWFSQLSTDEKENLHQTILLGLPGSFQSYTLEEFKNELAAYKNISKEQLRQHLKFFLEQIVPVAEANEIKLAIHPDDPPWSQMGLPRIVSNVDDLEFIVNSVPSPANGITLCTGSLGAGYYNNLAEISLKLAEKVHFAHLRNVTCTANRNFWENNLFDGSVDIIAVTSNLLKEMDRRQKAGIKNWQIPMRPDHGYQMLGDIGMDNYPGYSLYGRMKSLAEFRGLEIGLLQSLGF